MNNDIKWIVGWLAGSVTLATATMMVGCGTTTVKPVASTPSPNGTAGAIVAQTGNLAVHLSNAQTSTNNVATSLISAKKAAPAVKPIDAAIVDNGKATVELAQAQAVIGTMKQDEVKLVSQITTKDNEVAEKDKLITAQTKEITALQAQIKALKAWAIRCLYWLTFGAMFFGVFTAIVQLATKLFPSIGNPIINWIINKIGAATGLEVAATGLIFFLGLQVWQVYSFWIKMSFIGAVVGFIAYALYVLWLRRPSAPVITVSTSGYVQVMPPAEAVDANVTTSNGNGNSIVTKIP